jgi:hypothetical protein
MSFEVLRDIIKNSTKFGGVPLYTKLADFAPGIKDRNNYGNVKDIPLYKKLKFVVQNHYARKAGFHHDIRLGDKELHSFVSKHGLPKPGEKRLFIQQPLHTREYADFRGEIKSGYGAGKVTTNESGSAIVTKAEPKKINFTLLHRKFPEQFSLINTKGKNWLALNTSPTNAKKYIKNPEALNKLKMKSLTNPDLKELSKTHLISAKLSGASNLFRLNKNSVDVVSYRVSKTGRPIIHTLKMFGLDKQDLDIPDELVGTILRGELYGIRNGEAIPEQTLGGLLNSSTEKSLNTQKKEKIKLKAAIFDIVGFKGGPDNRRAKIQEILQHLPKDKFEEVPYLDRENVVKKIQDIAKGKNKLTSEGVVAWSRKNNEPFKLKNFIERDVYARGFSEGKGRLKNKGVGAVKYSLTPKSKVVGEVASGLTDATRKDIYNNPKDYLGRIANVRYSKQMRSGALFQPSFLTWHESK